ncbi:MAG: hypothetical protein IKI37_08210 [Oscillospiraceae bacterium]|nr:hypothetical protein [Oscillospiraceae bacterium]
MTNMYRTPFKTVPDTPEMSIDRSVLPYSKNAQELSANSVGDPTVTVVKAAPDFHQTSPDRKLL